MKKKIILAVCLASALFSAVPARADSSVSQHLAKMETDFIADETSSDYLKGVSSSSRETRLWLSVKKYSCRTTRYSDGRIINRYTVSYRMTKKQAASAFRKEKAIAKKAKKKGLRYIYDSTRKVKYHCGSNLDYTPYGALVLKKASCEGITLAFTDACTLAGYSTKIIRGRDRKGGAHMWAAVRVKGKWKYFDPTWDIGRKYTKYYMKSASYMKKTGHFGQS